MDLMLLTCFHIGSTEPRLRGDGPPRRFGTAASSSRTPPTRGWTLEIEVPDDTVVQNPAYAGMDPLDTH